MFTSLEQLGLSGAARDLQLEVPGSTGELLLLILLSSTRKREIEQKIITHSARKQKLS
jgi:hypothetical protein